MQEKREQWTSRLGFVLAAAGSVRHRPQNRFVCCWRL